MQKMLLLCLTLSLGLLASCSSSYKPSVEEKVVLLFSTMTDTLPPTTGAPMAKKDECVSKLGTYTDVQKVGDELSATVKYQPTKLGLFKASGSKAFETEQQCEAFYTSVEKEMEALKSTEWVEYKVSVNVKTGARTKWEPTTRSPASK